MIWLHLDKIMKGKVSENRTGVKTNDQDGFHLWFSLYSFWFQVRPKGAKAVGPTPRHHRPAKQTPEAAAHPQRGPKPTAPGQSPKATLQHQGEGRGKVEAKGGTWQLSTQRPPPPTPPQSEQNVPEIPILPPTALAWRLLRRSAGDCSSRKDDERQCHHSIDCLDVFVLGFWGCFFNTNILRLSVIDTQNIQ